MALTKIPSELSSTTGIVDNSNATAITIDSSENVVIGHTSALASTTNRGNITLNGANDSILALGNGGSLKGYLLQDSGGMTINSLGATYQRFYTNNSERMRIDSSGNVGIGTSSPTFSSGTYGGLHVNGSNGTSLRMTNAASGQTASDGYEILLDPTSKDTLYVNRESANQRFYTGGSERMRIDSSGRVTTPSQPHIYGSPTHTTNNGFANAFATSSYSRNTLSFANSKITVPVGGIYLINFQTISSNGTGRLDAYVKVNGVTVATTLTATNDSGYRQRALSIVVSLSANDYIQFYNTDWYNYSVTSFDVWRTASVTLIG